MGVSSSCERSFGPAAAQHALLLALLAGPGVGCDRIVDPVATEVLTTGDAGQGAAPVLSTADAPGEALGGRSLLGSFDVVYWPFEEEVEFGGVVDALLPDANCQPLANVPAAFADSLCSTGSGSLADGSVVNLGDSCDCGYPCPTESGASCFLRLDPATYPWGIGHAEAPIVPLRSLTVDVSLVEHGTVVYVPALDGLEIPERFGSRGEALGAGGFIHDGCLRADDTGYGIAGWTVALAAGPVAMFSWLEFAIPSDAQVWELYDSGPRCAYLAEP
jgi:hypothetical protein